MSRGPCAATIKEKFESTERKFNLAHVNPLEVMRQINSLDKNKSNSGNIPTSLLQETKNIICPYLTDCINSAIFEYKFQDELKEANVSPVSKADDKTSKLNYRPISVLQSAFKIYERVLKALMSALFEGKLQGILCGFRESFSTQHAPMRVIEEWKKCLDNCCMVGTISMDRSKAYDYLPHEL